MFAWLPKAVYGSDTRDTVQPTMNLGQRATTTDHPQTRPSANCARGAAYSRHLALRLAARRMLLYPTGSASRKCRSLLPADYGSELGGLWHANPCNLFPQSVDSHPLTAQPANDNGATRLRGPVV